MREARREEGGRGKRSGRSGGAELGTGRLEVTVEEGRGAEQPSYVNIIRKMQGSSHASESIDTPGRHGRIDITWVRWDGLGEGGRLEVHARSDQWTGDERKPRGGRWRPNKRRAF